ncbi:DinB family protein [Streptomyces sp. NPDC087901]|uniref:DinB family protein n=1 Tax=Streptomyces sp. NPDC087901 TaxID=3365818 RepID=UPI003825B67D
MQDQNEYLFFLRRAFDGMLNVLEDLGDDLANTRPPLPGANSVYAIAYHCAAVANYWTGHIIAGREIDRDRASEFTATGHVKDFCQQVDELFEQLKVDLAQVIPSSLPRNTPPADFEGPERPLSVQGVQLHVLEELAQHHGQIQITRDLLKPGASS